eukprot:4145924-Karenia_brevis.AAC.1
MKLVRGFRNERGRELKIHRRVIFPEVLPFLRSGPYHFLAAVLHHGLRTNEGHFTTLCWLGGDEYVKYNDEKPVERATWNRHVASAATQRDVYLLMYMRAGYWEGLPRTGVESTPYVREVPPVESVETGA